MNAGTTIQEAIRLSTLLLIATVTSTARIRTTMMVCIFAVDLSSVLQARPAVVI